LIVGGVIGFAFEVTSLYIFWYDPFNFKFFCYL
jgi:hypothetical protein